MAGRQAGQQQPQRAAADQPAGGNRSGDQADPHEAGEPCAASGAPDCRFLVAAGLIVAVALLLRLYRLGGQELWLDEVLSWRLVTMPKSLGTFLIQNTPPLYYLLLHAGVADGDVVIFTGARGHPALYYLSRMGYRVDDWECRDAQTGQKFGCRLYPRDPEVLDSPEMVRAQVRDYLRPLAPERGAVWVATESGRTSQGKLLLGEQDALLIRELQRTGLEFSPVNLPLRVFRFCQS